MVWPVSLGDFDKEQVHFEFRIWPVKTKSSLFSADLISQIQPFRSEKLTTFLQSINFERLGEELLCVYPWVFNI